MRLRTVLLAIAALVLLALVIVALGSAGLAGAADPSPSCSPTPIATPTPDPPASPGLRAWALHWRAVAVRGRARCAEIRAAFRLETRHVTAGRIGRHCSKAEAFKLGRAWRADARHFHASSAEWYRRIVHPGGGGALRWRPLIRYVWGPISERLVLTLAHIVWHESSGRPRAMYNPSDPRSATGLFQIFYGAPRFLHPLTCAREAFRKWRADRRTGGSGLRPWATCRAFSHAPFAPGCGLY